MTADPTNLAELLKEWAQLNAELERHQRLVTVMFTDIAGSTRYFDEYGDLAGMAMLTAVNGRLQPLVTKHSGTIVKTIGDAIMAYFESPLEAVRCSVEMQQATEGLDPQGIGRPIQIRVALNLGVGLMKDNDVFGDVVNVCSRIEHETPTGRIGISPSVVEAVTNEKEIRCRPMGTVELRGKAEKMELYEVVWREEDVARAEQPAARVSTEQLAMAAGTMVKMGDDVRAAIAAALKGKQAKSPVALVTRQFLLAEEDAGGELGRRHMLVQGRLLVGRKKGDLLFDDDSLVSAEHALFSNISGALYVEDLGSAHGVFVRLRGPYDLQEGDTILMGRQVFRFHLEPGAVKSTATPGQAPVLAHLVPLEGGSESGQKYPLRRGETVLGRLQGDHTFPENKHLSRRHARITVHASYAVLEDLNSTNGTFVRIRGKHLLDVDDRVMFGRQVLRVIAEEVPGSNPHSNPAPVLAPPPPAVETGPPLLAVLEFENLSGDGGLDWLATGMAETLSADLKRLEQVRVAGRERTEQALRHLGPQAGAIELGRELRARWVVVGSFQGAAGRIRVTARVVEAATGDVVASCKIDGAWEELFSLQDRVVVDMMGALEVKLDSRARERIAVPETRTLEAYEVYSLGRKKFFELGKNSLEEARQHFQRAVELDPSYAMAYSGLGATHAMRYVHRTDPGDLEKSQQALERAVELDAELAEPYPWLCYIYARQARREDAVSAGRKGVELQPDLVQAHYFLGCAHMFAAEPGEDDWNAAVKHLTDATTVEPRWFASWLVLSWIALTAGAYERAEAFARAAEEQEKSPATLGSFPGASQVMLGGVWLRRGEWERAEECYHRGLELLEKQDRTYREAFQAFSCCGLGDVKLRCDQADEALTSYRRAWRIVQEFPRMLANERARVRTLAGLAATYAAQGMTDKARQLAGEAGTLLQDVIPKPHTWVWEGSTPQLCHGLAVAWILLEDKASALDLLERGVQHGWRDPDWLERDPALAPLRQESRFCSLLKKVRELPPLDFGAA